MSNTQDPNSPGAPPLPEGVMQMPLVLLNNVNLRIDALPNGEKMIVIGPLALGIPMSSENEKWLREQLSVSGIKVVGPGILPRL